MQTVCNLANELGLNAAFRLRGSCRAGCAAATPTRIEVHSAARFSWSHERLELTANLPSQIRGEAVQFRLNGVLIM